MYICTHNEKGQYAFTNAQNWYFHLYFKPSNLYVSERKISPYSISNEYVCRRKKYLYYEKEMLFLLWIPEQTNCSINNV